MTVRIITTALFLNVFSSENIPSKVNNPEQSDNKIAIHSKQIEMMQAILQEQYQLMNDNKNIEQSNEEVKQDIKFSNTDKLKLDKPLEKDNQNNKSDSKTNQNSKSSDKSNATLNLDEPL